MLEKKDVAEVPEVEGGEGIIALEGPGEASDEQAEAPAPTSAEKAGGKKQKSKKAKKVD